MRSASMRIHGTANDLLPPPRRHTRFIVQFELPTGLRDLIQSTGVPHVELEQVVVDGTPVRYAYVVDDGADIEATSRYPLAAPPAEPAFVLDVHLRRLAHYLRLFGFDAGHEPDAGDRTLAEVSVAEGRILLTRDRSLLMRSRLRQASFVRSIRPRDQIVEVLHRFALTDAIAPLSRCLVCGERLEQAPVETVASHVPDGVRERHQDFSRCGGCHRVYWRGSHTARLSELVDTTLARLR